jgi:hypothetical protein
MLPLTVKKLIFTDVVFWRMKISSNTKTKAAATTPNQAAEIRVRPGSGAAGLWTGLS